MTISSSSRNTDYHIPLLMIGSALGGATALWGWQNIMKKKKDPEIDYEIGHSLVWGSISGAMNAAMMYTGDKLKLYKTMRELCKEPESSTTAIKIANETGYNQRWVREWLAQQAAMGVLRLLPGDGDDDGSLKYRLPFATGEVLANPDSSEYDVAMIQAVPSLVNRAKTMLPEAFKTGVGRPYDEADVAEAIDRQHATVIRDFFIPKLLPKVLDGKVLKMLNDGCQVCDLGCGAGILLVSLARAFPKSTFHGFEISKVALEKASFNVASARLSNVYLHDANEKGEQLGDRRNMFDLALIYDVLHDSTHPVDLVKQVKTALKQDGIFLLADIPCKPSIRENLTDLVAPGTYYGFSACLCMSCSLSTEDGAGIGTLGFSIPVAQKMVTENGGFTSCEVIAEEKNTRWFLVT